MLECGVQGFYRLNTAQLGKEYGITERIMTAVFL
jgi:hypothetical protein